jgi:hypothetical protein
MSVLTTIETDLKLVWKLFSDIVYAVWTAEKNALLVDATTLMKAEGVAIQNAQPGIGTKAFIELLITTATPLLVGDLATIGVAGITAVAATIAEDLGIPDAGGNAGVLS